MGLSETLQRRIKPLKYESDDEPASEDEEPPDPERPADDSQALDASDNSEDAETEDSNEDSAPSEQDFRTISFGALARAQESLSQPNRSSAGARPSSPNAEAAERKAGKLDKRDFSRSSKHAPAERSSKKAVSRRRAVVAVPKPDARDPRFEPVSGPLDPARTTRNYAFLATYRASEMAQLRADVRASAPAADATYPLQRALRRMESQQRAQEAKDREREVLRAHRTAERERVRAGKRPFYLKKAERRKLALVERFAELAPKQLDRAIGRRRKKKAGKERRGMPAARRGGSDG